MVAKSQVKKKKCKKRTKVDGKKNKTKKKRTPRVFNDVASGFGGGLVKIAKRFFFTSLEVTIWSRPVWAAL